MEGVSLTDLEAEVDHFKIHKIKIIFIRFIVLLYKNKKLNIIISPINYKFKSLFFNSSKSVNTFVL